MAIKILQLPGGATGLRKRQYDLVLINILMPEMDGITATQEIRQI